MKADRLPLEISSFRACSPGETFQRVSPFLSRLGITRLGRQTDLDRIGIPVWCAYAPNAKAIVIAQGKGLDDDAARTSAVMEAIERSVATHPSCETVTRSLADLHATGHITNSLTSLISAKARPIRADEQIQWTTARDLLTNTSVWLPFEAVHLDRTLITPRYWQSSDGLASGNRPEEAIAHGLIERVERDALTLWQVTSLAERHRKRIDTSQIDSTELAEILARIDKAGLEIALFDITTDLDIACTVALLGPMDRSAPAILRHVDITLGAGCSPSPEIAAIRAITEAVQSRMTFIAGARDDLTPDTFTRMVDPATLAAFDAPVACSLDSLPRLPPGSAGQTLDLVLGRLRSKGISQIYAVDLTPEWLPVHVFKVIAPQLENPDGERRQRYGMRVIARALQ